MTVNNNVTAYPLAWPAGWKRTETYKRTRAAFGRKGATNEYGWKPKEKLTVADSRDRLNSELNLLGAASVVISSNLVLRGDGQPRSGQPEPADPGVCVYFRLNGNPRCLPCDKWDRAADNLAAIAKFVDAMRGQIRWGVGSVDAAFAGFKALPGAGSAIVTPPSMTVEQAAQLIAAGGSFWEGLITSPEQTARAYKARALECHPDRGGDAIAWSQLQQALDVLKRHHGNQ